MNPFLAQLSPCIGAVETPSLDLDFSNSRSIFAKKGATPVLTRDSAGTYVDEYGVIRNSNSNLLLYSNSLETTGGFWSSSSSGTAVSIATNQILSPDNSINASLLTFPAVTTGTFAVWQQSIATSTTGNYVFSVWLRSGTLSNIWIRLKTNLGDSDKQLCKLTSTWQRYFFNANISSAITNMIVEIGANGNNVEEINSAGNLYVWGAQLESSSYLGKYSPTISSSVNNAPRFDHDSSQVESLATNLNTNSEDFSAGVALYGMNISTNFATAPDGTLTADRLVETNAFNYHLLVKSTTSEINKIYTLSVFIKKYSSGGTDARYTGVFTCSQSGSDLRFHINIDLQSGTVTSIKRGLSSGTYAARTNYKIEDYGTYWRVSISHQSTATSLNYGIYLSNSASPSYDSRGDYQYTGDGTSGITVWGMQYQEGLIATKYIKTTGSIATGTGIYKCKGLLIEESRTNLLTYSEDFLNAIWSQNNLTSVSANFAIAPNGLFSADKIFEDANNNYHSIVTAITSISGQPYTGSIFVRKYTGDATERRYVQVFLSTGTGTPPPRYLINVDLQNGTVTDAVIKTGATGTSQKIEDYGAYWKISLSIIAANTSLAMIIGISNSATPTYHSWGDVTYTGTATIGIVIWGAQIEQGAFSTTYIPTSGSTFSRNADSCSISSTDFTNFYNQTEGTSRIEYVSKPNSSGTYSLTTYKDATNSFFLKQYRTFSTETSLYKGDASIGAQFDYASQGVDGFGEMTIAYKNNDFSSSFNGGNFKTDSSGVISSFASLSFGCDENSANLLNGCISRVRYYKKKITDNKIKSSSYQDELNWRNVGPQYYQNYKTSIANTKATITVSDTTTTPSAIFPGSASFSSSVLLLDGRVFIVPYNSATARIYDVALDTLTIPSGSYAGASGFSGGVLLKDGRVFIVPQASTTARIYDPISDTLSTPNGTYPGGQAYSGGVLLPDGRVFCVPYGVTSARIYDPISNTLSIPNGVFPSGSYQFEGGILLPDGRVFCIPTFSTTARIYDPITNTLTTPNGSYPGNYAYSGGVLLPDGRVFCIPCNTTTARIYDPITNTTITPSGTYASNYAFSGGVLLPNGKVFCIPHMSTIAKIYDPITDTLSNATGTFPGSTSFSGGTLLFDGRIFCSPYSSTSARIYGGGGGFNKNIALSSYYNKF